MILDDQALFDDLPHRKARRKRAVRVLEYDLHVTPERPHALRIVAVNAVAEIDDRPFARHEPEQGKAERGLARTRLAYDTKRLALFDGEIDAVDRLDVTDDVPQEAALDREPHLQVLGLENGDRLGISRRRRTLRLRGKQVLGVRMLWRGEDLLCPAALDDFPAVHDAHPVGHFPHDAEVVRDEQHGHMEFVLELGEKVEDLRLDGDVERGSGLVGDEQVWLIGQRHGDHHPLPLTARKLMRIGGKPPLGIVDADLVEQVKYTRARSTVRQPAMNLQYLADLLLDGMQRIE